MGSKKHRQSDTKNPWHVRIGHAGDTSTFMSSFCWVKKKIIKKNSLILGMFLLKKQGKQCTYAVCQEATKNKKINNNESTKRKHIKQSIESNNTQAFAHSNKV